MKNILVISNSYDLHVDLVEKIVAEKGANLFRLNLDNFPRDYEFDLQYFGECLSGQLRHIPSQQTISLSKIDSVWLRKDGEFAFINDTLDPQSKAFAKDESEHFLFSLLYSLPVFWMNHPKAVRGAMWKGEQIQRAAKLGFNIPRTIMTNDPAAVRQFKQAVNSDFIFKAMSSPYLGAEQVSAEDRIAAPLPTTMVTDEMMQQLDAVQQAPCLFQEYIPKEFEVRATVIGDEIFCAKIHSQEDELTKTDCRDMSAPITYEAFELPNEIASRCLQFLKSYDLNYGALDFIVTPDKQFVFLENNPSGQFLFVEQLVPELTMLNAIAERLIKA